MGVEDVYCCDEWAWVGSIYFIQMAMIFTHVINNLCILIQQELDWLSYDDASFLLDSGDEYLTLGHVLIALIWKAQLMGIRINRVDRWDEILRHIHLISTSTEVMIEARSVSSRE
jgi:hypothetical protein